MNRAASGMAASMGWAGIPALTLLLAALPIQTAMGNETPGTATDRRDPARFHHQSSDATLSALEIVTADGKAVALTPAFAPDRTDYTAQVDHDFEEVTIRPTPSDSGAIVEYLDVINRHLAYSNGDTEGLPVQLLVSDNTFRLKVTSEDEAATRTYTVVVNRTPLRKLIIYPTTPLTIDEGGDDTFTVKLTSQPTGNVTVTVNTDDATAVSVSRNALLFNRDNWNTEQTVRVSGVEDRGQGHESVQITLRAAGGGYEGKGGAVVVRVKDDEAPEVKLVLTPRTLAIGEDDTGTFTVRLNTRPKADVSVSVESSQRGIATAAPASVSFTRDDWQMARTVTVTTYHDSDNKNDSVNINLSASGADYKRKTGIVAVSVLDDDTTAPGLVIEPTLMEMPEDSSSTFTVKLATQPTGNVTVRLESDDTGVVNLSDERLRYSTSTWDAPQTVTVYAESDDDSKNDNAGIKLKASGGGYGGKTGRVLVDVIDDDTSKPAMVVNPQKLTMKEGGAGSFTVSLASEPSGTVTLQVRVFATDLAAIAPNSVSYTYLTFTTSNWWHLQTVTLNALEDDDTDRNFLTVTLMEDGSFLKNRLGAVSVVIEDNDTPGIVLNQKSLALEEEGIGDVTVQLATQPSRTVTMALTSDDTEIATVSPASLTFTTGDWNSPRSVRVRGVADADALDERAIVSLAVTGSGDDYSGLNAEVAVNVRDTDNKIKVSFTAKRYDATESGAPANVVVQLSRANSEDVTFPIDLFAPSNSTRESDYSGVPESVTIPAGQDRAIFTVTAMDDVVSDEDSDRLLLELGEIPPGFVAKKPVKTTVRLIDNDAYTGPPVLTIHEATAEEGEDLVFLIEIERPTDNHVTMWGWTKGITATKHRDYDAPDIAEGLATQVGRGLTSAEVRLATKQDSIKEGDETLEVGISRSGTYRIQGSRTVTGTILDDD